MASLGSASLSPVYITICVGRVGASMSRNLRLGLDSSLDRGAPIS